MRKFLIWVTLIALLTTSCFASSLTLTTQLAEQNQATLETTRKIPVVMYHSVDAQSDPINSFVVTPEQFESDLQYLQEHGYTTLSISDLIDFVNGEKYLPEKPILLTFDDGYADNYDNAFPLLLQYQAKAAISCVMVHYDVTSDDARPRFTAEQGIEMVESGLVELQNHTYNLHQQTDHYGVLPAIGQDLEAYRVQLEEDIDASKAKFEALGWPAATTFTYPYGASSEEVLEIVKDNGYTVSLVTVAESTNVVVQGDPDSLFELSRFDRSYGYTTEEYFSMVEEFYGN